MRNTLFSSNAKWLVGSILLISMVVGAIVVSVFVGAVRDKILTELLSPYGIQRLHTDIESLSFDALTLNQIAVTYAKNGINARISLNNIALEKARSEHHWYSLAAWSIAAQQANITLKTVSIGTKNGATASQAINDEPLNPADWLPQNVLNMIPMNQIVAEQVTLHFQHNDGAPWDVSGQIALSPDWVEASLEFAYQAHTFPGQLKFTKDNIYLLVGTPANPWIKVETRLDRVDQHFVAGGVLTVNDIYALDDWIVLASERAFNSYGMKGQFHGAYSVTVSEAVLKQWLDQAIPPIDYQGVNFNAHLTANTQFDGDQALIHQVKLKGSARVQLEEGRLRVSPVELSTLQMNLNAKNEALTSAAQQLVGESDTLAVKLSAVGDVEMAIDQEDITVNINEGLIKLGASRDALDSQLHVKGLSSRFKDREIQSLKGVTKLNLALIDKPPLKGIVTIDARRETEPTLRTTSSKKLMVGQLNATLEDLTSVLTEFEYDEEQQLVDFKVRSERANLATETFNQWAEKMSLPLALELGDMALSMQGQLDLNNLPGLSTAGDVLVAGWQGSLDKNHFSALDSPFAFSGGPSAFTVEAEVTNGLFDIGIPITDIHYYVTLQGSLDNEDFTLSLKNLEGKLVGGTVRIPAIEWDSKVQSTQFNVVISDWQFSEMIKLLERDDLVVSGTLDGMLPISIEQDGVLIQHGLLTARKPGGVIQYTPDSTVKGMLSGQQELKMAADILENFEYEQLDVLLNQDIEFNQTLALTLRGKNPNVYGGTPVNLNLNIDHNILPLIQSLTLPGKVQEHWNELDKLQP